MKNILVVEDEKKIQNLIADYFRMENYNVITADDGFEGLYAFETNELDLVIMDVMMPVMNGWELCKKIREKSDVPIIMLTARGTDDDMIAGFDLKADEYVVKPFSPKVLVARAKMLIMRSSGSLVDTTSSVIGDDIISIDKGSMEIKVDGEPIDLPLKAYEILLYLVENSNTVFSREQILEHVWGYDYFGDDRVVDNHMKKIRKKLGERSYVIRTVFGVGYKHDGK